MRGSEQGISRSRYAEQLYGWTAAEILGQSASALVPPEMLEQGQEIIARLRRGERWSGEFVVRRRDGSTFPALVTDSPLRDHLGNLVGIAGVLRLVELHAALPEDVRELLPEAVVSLDHACQLVMHLYDVTRIATHETPLGPALDLERSAAPDEPSPGASIG